MGYRVGNECFESYDAAMNHKIAHVTPVLTASGVVFPVRTSDGWFLNQQKIVLDFPPCSIADDFQNGMEISAAFFVLCLTAFVTRKLIDFIHKCGTAVSGCSE